MSYDQLQRGFTIPGMMWPSELKTLHDLFRKSERHAEIGCYCGRSLWATAAGMYEDRIPEKQIIAVDDRSLVTDVLSPIWVSDVLKATQREIYDAFYIRVSVYEDTSEAVASLLARDARDFVFDSVFIDADHSQEMVARDIVAWWSVLRVGGVMAGHDYGAEFPGVMNAVQDIFQGAHTVMNNTRIWALRKNRDTKIAFERYYKRAVA